MDELWQRVFTPRKCELHVKVGIGQTLYINPFIPDWARYIAVDKNGDVYAYEEVPIGPGHITWTNFRDTQYTHIGEINAKRIVNWGESFDLDRSEPIVIHVEI